MLIIAQRTPGGLAVDDSSRARTHDRRDFRETAVAVAVTAPREAAPPPRTASPYPGSTLRPAEISEIDALAVEGMPSTNTAEQPLLGGPDHSSRVMVVES